MRRRIVMVVTFVAVSAIVALMIPTVLAVRERALYAAKLELQREGAQVASSLGPDEPLAMSSLKMIGNGEVHVVGLYDHDGRLVAGSGPPVADELVLAALAGSFAESALSDEYVVASPIARYGGNYAAVRVAESYADPNADARRHLRPLFAVALAIVLAAAAAARWLAQAITRPLGLLRVVAMRIGRGELSEDVPVTGLPELDDLGSTIGSMADEIESQMARERAFSAQVSHQLRTPVTALQVALETELAAPRDDATLVLAEALGAVGRLNSTIAELLSLSRGQANDRCELRLDVATEAVLKPLAGGFAAANRQLVCELQPVHVVASASAVEHVLTVLLENSLQHGRGTTTIRTGVTADGPVLSVGDGAVIQRDPFVAQVRSGHGIGLKLARGLAEAESAHLVLVVTDTGHRFELRFEPMQEPTLV